MRYNEEEPMEILRKLAQLAGTDRTAIVYGDGRFPTGS